MNSTSLSLVNFEQAKRLKAAGFDWRTEDFYATDKSASHRAGELWRPHSFLPESDWNIHAPTVALALKWMRDVEGFAFYVRCEHERETNSERVYFDPVSWYGEYENSGAISNTDTVNTYESAESALLDELLTLIENK